MAEADGANHDIKTRPNLTYASPDGIALTADLYQPAGEGPFPVMIGVHGGGWVQGARSAFQHWGPYLAARGIALFAISYRLAIPGQPTFPHAVQDVLAAIRYLRGNAVDLHIAPDRIGLFGHSAGAHLASLAALAGDSPSFADADRHAPQASTPTSVKVLAGLYGVYDLAAMWQTYNVQTPHQNNIERLLGVSLPDNRRLYFDASPISYAITAKNKIAVHLSVGTEDDLVDRAAHTDAFVLALKQAGFFVRTCVVPGAPHYWGADPIDEPGSYSGVLAPRLLRFLQEKL